MERKTITLLEGFQVCLAREICENKRGDSRVLKVECWKYRFETGVMEFWF